MRCVLKSMHLTMGMQADTESHAGHFSGEGGGEQRSIDQESSAERLCERQALEQALLGK